MLAAYYRHPRKIRVCHHQYQINNNRNTHQFDFTGHTAGFRRLHPLTITLVDEDTDEEKTWQIVGEHEANIEAGLLNIKSPIARALIGKDEGDSVEVRTPGGGKSYEVLKVEYI